MQNYFHNIIFSGKTQNCLGHRTFTLILQSFGIMKTLFYLYKWGMFHKYIFHYCWFFRAQFWNSSFVDVYTFKLIVLFTLLCVLFLTILLLNEKFTFSFHQNIHWNHLEKSYLKVELKPHWLGKLSAEQNIKT